MGSQKWYLAILKKKKSRHFCFLGQEINYRRDRTAQRRQHEVCIFLQAPPRPRPHLLTETTIHTGSVLVKITHQVCEVRSADPCTDESQPLLNELAYPGDAQLPLIGNAFIPHPGREWGRVFRRSRRNSRIRSRRLGSSLGSSPVGRVSLCKICVSSGPLKAHLKNEGFKRHDNFGHFCIRGSRTPSRDLPGRGKARERLSLSGDGVS